MLYAQRTRREVLWVFAAGNECRDATFQSPASLVQRFPLNVITVANVDRSGGLEENSNFGPLITVAAPGTDIHSTVPRDCLVFALFCDDKYVDKTGTSMAAPHVTGLAGLLFSHNPRLTAAQAKTRIVNAARRRVPRCRGATSMLLMRRPPWPVEEPSTCRPKWTSCWR